MVIENPTCWAGCC